MTFHETRFSPEISFGATSGVERRTEIVALVSGFEERNSPWSQSRRRYDAGLGVRSLDDLAEVLRFFEARMGRLHAFRWKDWLDHKSCLPSATPGPLDQVQSGSGTVWQLTKRYSDSAGDATRTIVKPVAGSVRVAIDTVELSEGPDFGVDTTTGEITFVTAPDPAATVTAGFQFDVPVRFDADLIEVNLAAFEAGEIPAIPIIEVRL